MDAYYDEWSRSYDAAQICLNGHVTNPNFHDGAVDNVDHCRECGKQTIAICPACKVEIRGQHRRGGVLVAAPFYAPAFCHGCGKAYPWTEAGRQAARDYADELDELGTEEKEQFKGSLDDLICQTPRTDLAILRLRKIVKKIGKESYEGFKHVLAAIACEAVKKAIFPP